MRKQFIILMAFLMALPALAQSNNFEGTVYAEDKVTPAVGITIVVKAGKKQTLTSSEKGTFVIENVKFPAKAIFKGADFERKVYTINSMADSVFILKHKYSANNELEKNKSETGSVDDVDMSNSDGNTHSIVQRLKNAGVVFRGDQMSIRGTNSINLSSSPLVLVDGQRFGGSISDLDVSTVKSIRVLKGSETSMYGRDGSAGVILITTGVKE